MEVHPKAEAVRQQAAARSATFLYVVFGSSVSAGDTATTCLLETCMRSLVRPGTAIVNGGYQGTMTASASAVRRAGGTAIGVPCANLEDAIAYEPFDLVFPATDQWERLRILIEVADAFIILPGGIGSIVEIAAALWSTDRGFGSRRPMLFLGNHWKEWLRVSGAGNLAFRRNDTLHCVTFATHSQEVEAFFGVTDSSNPVPATIDNAGWWERALHDHLASEYYDLPGFVVDLARLTIGEDDLLALGPLDGKDVLHLQCNFGLDTISLARLGARAVGADNCVPALAAARALAERCAADAIFVEWDANGGDLAQCVGERQFDTVFASYGVLDWVADLHDYFMQACTVLRPGGMMYLVEVHPVAKWLMRCETDSNAAYCAQTMTHERGASYATGAEFGALTAYAHPLHAIVTAMLLAGLELVLMEERPSSSYRFHRSMTMQSDGRWAWPKLADGAPMILALGARKAA